MDELEKLKQEVLELEEKLAKLQCRYDKIMEALQEMPISISDWVDGWEECR